MRYDHDDDAPLIPRPALFLFGFVLGLLVGLALPSVLGGVR